MESNFKQLLKKVKTFVLDVDGVLTDGSLILLPDGELVRTMNIRDGYALQLAIRKGYSICIISGGNSDIIRQRLSRLGIKDIYMTVRHKLEKINEYFEENDIDPSTVLFMGDDIPDYEAMRIVGVPTCPANAAQEIKDISIYVSQIDGGKGCVRDVMEQVMKVQGNWMNDDGFNW